MNSIVLNSREEENFIIGQVKGQDAAPKLLKSKLFWQIFLNAGNWDHHQPEARTSMICATFNGSLCFRI